MSSIEKQSTLELTRINVERANNSPELEKYKEVEQKLVPVHPEALNLFKESTLPIEQIYLSTPHDEFSLRVRCEYTPEGPKYTATQKDRDTSNEGALERREISTPISEQAYQFYQEMQLPSVRKLRAEPFEGVTIDFYDSIETPVLVEIEHRDAATRRELLSNLEEFTGAQLEDRSHDQSLTNEALAFAPFELPPTPEELDSFTERIFRQMVAHYVMGKNQVVVGVTGMSGSGKTTVTNALKDRLVQQFGEEFLPITLSTDDYHFGKTHLEREHGAPYSDWDAERTYNVAELAADLARLAEGAPLIKRRFDFQLEEPVFESEIPPSPFVIVEGVHAGSKALDQVRDIHFELPTGIATSIGRDVRRLVIDRRANRAFPTPESRLKYQIETALPLYLSLERPEKKSFSASSRPLAERAFMLSQLG